MTTKRYLVTIGPRQALEILTKIDKTLGDPTENITKEESKAKGMIAHIKLQEELDKIKKEEIIILFSSFVTLIGITESLSTRIIEHLEKLGHITVRDIWNGEE